MRTLQPLRGVPALLIVCPLLLLAFVFRPLATQAASIEVVADETLGHPALILIKGQLLKGEVQHDVTTFETLSAIQRKQAIVLLESQGGMTWTALQIGKIIQRHGFSTAVADEAVCASACALIWLAGNERFMASTARVGFHASSTGENPGGEVSSYGNAIVGAYLYEIGLREPATIIYVTKASPQSMTWLTMSDAMRYGIAAKAFSLSQDEWSWARDALTGSGARRRIDPPVPLPATRPARSAPHTSADTRMAEARRVEEILAQAARHVSSGDVIGARDMLAAAEDSAQGPVTFALAETYDPNMLAAWGSRGVTSDIVRAKVLYCKALEFGVTKAQMRLEALNAPCAQMQEGDRKRPAAGMEVPPLAGFSGSVEAIDTTLQATPLWQILKRNFPDWYAERVKEAAALAAQNKNDAAIGQQMARALVALRRQNFSYALVASFPKLKAIATIFYENLVELQKASTDVCFNFISQGEAGSTTVALLQGSPHVAHLQAQLIAVFEAIADGRKTMHVYPPPSKADYNALASELTQRGWTQADMQLFSDERALAHAGAAKVCQMVKDWFAAQLAIKDADMQLRLLVDSLKPVVAG